MFVDVDVDVDPSYFCSIIIIIIIMFVFVFVVFLDYRLNSIVFCDVILAMIIDLLSFLHLVNTSRVVDSRSW